MDIRVSDQLRFFLPVRHRAGPSAESGHEGVRDGVRWAYDEEATVGHLVEALGVPLTEVGELRADGAPVPPSYRPAPGSHIAVESVPRPQPMPSAAPWPPRFVLDVHLGALARRLRLVGVDTAYRNDAADPELVTRANAEQRILLTQDRGLLRRRALWLGAYVRGGKPDEQLMDVLTRFDVPLAPWTRCPSCNGSLVPVAKEDIADRIPPGTRRTYDSFTRCDSCSRIFWPGAHHARLAERVTAARRISAAANDASGAARRVRRRGR
ncbi:Mut7-C RNAse domain-containing protein [Streptomyces oceani]|uniref:Twitching motility protein PilT n=1 Tax=Streptomyces oceani TaxID=1075402 RepID=A0A1E7KHF2_9ACTN|nr:hypothetical protein AN216_11940 [Streptomyces oceani]